MPGIPIPLPTVPQAIFLGLATFVLLASLLSVVLRNLFHAALFLTAAFFGIAAIYALLEAEFLAIVQILVYIGAIATLIVFAIMLSRGITSQAGRLNAQWSAVAIGAFALFVVLITITGTVNWLTGTEMPPADSIARIGTDLVGSYVVPFEVASVLLLVALIGAILIARERE
jgi:NADH-quinone oxidoreductase subunit J